MDKGSCITIKLQMEDYPSNRDITHSFPLNINQEVLQPIDKPSRDCDHFTKSFMCTRPDTLRYIIDNRKRFIHDMSVNLAIAFTNAIAQHDTTMGYRDKAL